MKTTVGVFFGGRSTEHEISVISALQAINAFDKEKYQIVPIYITKQGAWFSGDALLEVKNYRDMAALQKMCTEVYMIPEYGDYNVYRKKKPLFGSNMWAKLDVVVPVLHGSNGEDGIFEGILESIGIPYAGCNTLASANGMDKITMKMIMEKSGIPIVDYVWFTDKQWFAQRDCLIEEIENKNVRYINSAIERAKFLLSTDKNIEGKLNMILEMYVHKWNTGKEEMQEEEETFLHIFDIFQSGFLDGESFYTPRESKGENNGEQFSEECFDDSELARQREQMDQKLKALVTQKSICEYVGTVLSDKGMMLGSAFPLSTNEDFIKLIFVRFFAGKKGTGYRVEPTGKMIRVNGFRFADFRIVR